MLKNLVSVLLGLVSIVFGAQSFAYEMEILTTEEPPMNFMDEGRISGFSTDVVKEVMRRTKTEGSIELIPWARAYKVGLSKANVALFTMGRTAKRENLFHWVGPIVGKRWVLFAKKTSKIQLNTLNDAKQYVIGIMRNDARSVYLKDQGFQKVHEVSDHTQALSMLIKGRVDLWASSDFEGPIITEKTEYQFSDLKVAFPLRRIESYIGISKMTSPEIAKNWQKAFAELKEDGTIGKIAAKWAGILDIPITGAQGIITFTDY